MTASVKAWGASCRRLCPLYRSNHERRRHPLLTSRGTTEPDPHMLKAADRAARRARVRLTLRQALAASLPLPDASADTVVSTLMLCSVPDRSAVLAEVKRVLRPGGQLPLLEHVRAADPALARQQDRRERSQAPFAGAATPTGTPWALSSLPGSTPRPSSRSRCRA
jgi:ubiquinone/menaquinone biosynthesis C-methylase UbiE